MVAPTLAAGIISSLYWPHDGFFSFLINQASIAMPDAAVGKLGMAARWSGVGWVVALGQDAPVASVVARHPDPSTVTNPPPRVALRGYQPFSIFNTRSALLHAAFPLLLCCLIRSDPAPARRRGDEAAAEPVVGASPDGKRRHGDHHAPLPLRAHLHQEAILL
jgi:hypothetical protein